MSKLSDNQKSKSPKKNEPRERGHQRRHVSFAQPVLHWADLLMEDRAISELSEYLATLVREDYDRRLRPNPPQTT